MTRLENFFIMCSGVERSILEKTSTENNKYIGIGATVFFTGVFAMIASSYALYTVFNNIYAACAFGFVWGLLIFNLDRYIVSSMKKKGSFLRDLTFAFPRLILAVIISIVISKPLELKIFETEIHAEIISMQQEKRKEHESLLKSRYEKDLVKLDEEIEELNFDVRRARKQKDELAAAALQEADGTGGSKIRNMGKIYQAKIAAAREAEKELGLLSEQNAPLLKEKEARKKEILTLRDAEMTSLEKASLTGFASRIEALNRISQKSNAILLAGLFLMLLFIAIETAPVFVKLISERSPYDFVLDKVEVAYEMEHKEMTTLKKLEVNNSIEYENKTKAHQNLEKIQAENELFSHALRAEVDQLKQNTQSLKDYLRKGSILKT